MRRSPEPILSTLPMDSQAHECAREGRRTLKIRVLGGSASAAAGLLRCAGLRAARWRSRGQGAVALWHTFYSVFFRAFGRTLQSLQGMRNASSRLQERTCWPRNVRAGERPARRDQRGGQAPCSLELALRHTKSRELRLPALPGLTLQVE